MSSELQENNQENFIMQNFPRTHNEQHGKTILLLARELQNNYFLKMTDFIHSISL